MRWLIDGYNLMHAAGALDGREIRRESFRRKRRRFLSDLADALGPERCRETTVVLDASTPPADFPLETVYQGLNLIFALGDENADARIEDLIAAHSAPKSLTVVSSDRRIRRAAQRRRARIAQRRRVSRSPGTLSDRQTAPKCLPRIPRRRIRSTATRRYRRRKQPTGWPSSASLMRHPKPRRRSVPDATLLTDAEIARIQKEIDSES